jgi:hypothetical protein
MGKAHTLHTPDASERVRDEWLRRVEAEYRSTAAAAHLALWLVQIGASPDLVRAALRIAREELGHATLSHRVYRAAGGLPGAGPRLERAGLELSRTSAEPLENDVARVCVEVFCLGETVAVRLFKELRQRCEVPVARRALDRVLRDEVGHRDFGWMLLDWLLALPGHGPRLRTQIASEAAGAIDELRVQYAPAGVATGRAISREDARWGLMPPARYGEVFGTAIDRDCVPRFARHGIHLPRLAHPRTSE